MTPPTATITHQDNRTAEAGEPKLIRSVLHIVRPMGWEDLISSPRPVPPEHVVQRYVGRAMLTAESRKLEDGTWHAHVPGFDGPWGTGTTEDDANSELREVLEDWIEMKRQDGDRDFPIVDGMDLNRLP